MKKITTRTDLNELARELGVRPDWHEPDQQDVTAVVRGTDFDNAMPPGHTYGSADDQRAELHVVLHRMVWEGSDEPKLGEPIAAVNLATLFAWATGYEADQPQRAPRTDASVAMYRWRDRYRREARDASNPADRAISVVLAYAFERAAEHELGIAELKERHPSGRRRTVRCPNTACAALLTGRGDLRADEELRFYECVHCGHDIDSETLRKLGL